MSGSSVAAVRDRIEPIDVGAVAVFVAVLYATTGGDLTNAVPFVVAGLVVPLFGRMVDYVGIPCVVKNVLSGSFIAGIGVWGIVEGANWFGAGIVAIGGWLVLDSIYGYYYGEPPDIDADDDDISEVEMYTLMGHSQWVHETLQEADRPLTAEELQERTGLTEDEFEDVLEVVQNNGTVERVGTGYVLDERNLGGVAFVRHIVRSVGGRILRPFRLFRPTR